jgi:hypothetical protein
VGDTEPLAVALAVGVGVDGEAEGDADCDGDGGADADGLGEMEALGLTLVLAAADEGEGGGELDGWVCGAARAAGVITLANAGPCALTDSPETRNPPVTRPAITVRPCVRDM